jgi:hypothetical protein
MANGELNMSAPMKSYRDLTVWQDAMELTAAIYDLTRDLLGRSIRSLIRSLQERVGKED